MSNSFPERAFTSKEIDDLFRAFGTSSRELSISLQNARRSLEQLESSIDRVRELAQEGDSENEETADVE